MIILESTELTEDFYFLSEIAKSLGTVLKLKSQVKKSQTRQDIFIVPTCDENYLKKIDRIRRSRSESVIFTIGEFSESQLLEIKSIGVAEHFPVPFNKSYIERRIASELKIVPIKDLKAKLSRIEWQIFLSIFGAREKCVSKETLFQAVFGDRNVSPKNLDVHLCHLRKKLIDTPFEVASKNGAFQLRNRSYSMSSAS